MKNLSFIMHADWSINPRKRIACCAVLQNNGKYRLHTPRPVGELSTLLHDVMEFIGSECCIIIGFDFPIGLPVQYAEIAGITEFLAFLPKFGYGKWSDFYTVAESAKASDQ